MWAFFTTCNFSFFRFHNIFSLFILKIIVEIVNQYQDLFSELGVELICEIGENIPPAYADVDAVDLIVTNLVQNALKYSLDNKCINIKLYQKNNQVILEVKDRGIGILEKDFNRIFEKFYRVENKTVNATEGSGLGLFLISHAVKAHKGEIKLESEPGKGSTFIVSFPIKTIEKENE